MRLRASPRNPDAVDPRPPLLAGRVIPAALFCPTLHVDSTRIRSILGTGVAWRVAYREDGRGISGARAPVRADGERSDRSGTEGVSGQAGRRIPQAGKGARRAAEP